MVVKVMTQGEILFIGGIMLAAIGVAFLLIVLIPLNMKKRKVRADLHRKYDFVKKKDVNRFCNYRGDVRMERDETFQTKNIFIEEVSDEKRRDNSKS